MLAQEMLRPRNRRRESKGKEWERFQKASYTPRERDVNSKDRRWRAFADRDPGALQVCH